MVAVFLGTLVLELPPSVVTVSRVILIFALLIQGGLWASSLLVILVPRFVVGSTSDPGAKSAVGLISFLGRVIIWSLVLVLVLDNAGVDITALVAGLGVGGIAVALAVQNVLGDLLSSLSIVLDKPFQVGDFIVVGDMVGTVERIGIKTTRLKALSGEQLISSNSDLLSSRIRNFKRLYERRVVFQVGVTYQTSAEKLRAIPEMIKEIIEKNDNVRFDRCHFSKFGDFALMFETVYYVTLPDYALYMDRQQSINLHIYTAFEKEGIEFAYPSQTLFLEGLQANEKTV